MGDVKRCWWAGTDPDYIRYHDREWGVPIHRDRRLFEMLILEGAQAGLSWLTILRKRQNYRRAFDRFDPEKVASYGARRKAALLRDEGIVRNRLKIDAAIANARAFLEIRAEHGTFNRYIWQFVDGKPKINSFRDRSEVPASTPESVAMSKDLRARGMNFVGPTICYAYMQSVGMVNDHLTDCHRYSALK